MEDYQPLTLTLKTYLRIFFNQCVLFKNNCSLFCLLQAFYKDVVDEGLRILPVTVFLSKTLH